MKKYRHAVHNSLMLDGSLATAKSHKTASYLMINNMLARVVHDDLEQRLDAVR